DHLDGYVDGHGRTLEQGRSGRRRGRQLTADLVVRFLARAFVLVVTGPAGAVDRDRVGVGDHPGRQVVDHGDRLADHGREEADVADLQRILAGGTGPEDGTVARFDR